eukprot:s125_g16.t1
MYFALEVLGGTSRFGHCHGRIPVAAWGLSRPGGAISAIDVGGPMETEDLRTSMLQMLGVSWWDLDPPSKLEKEAFVVEAGNLWFNVMVYLPRMQPGTSVGKTCKAVLDSSRANILTPGKAVNLDEFTFTYISQHSFLLQNFDSQLYRKHRTVGEDLATPFESRKMRLALDLFLSSVAVWPPPINKELDLGYLVRDNPPYVGEANR